VLNAQNLPQHDENRYEMKETQMLLASEMNKLSVQERSTVLDDVHCVGAGLVETPELVRQRLEEMEIEIQHHQRKNKDQIYEQACQQNLSYVQDPTFRLGFLRHNMYHVGQSVVQMMNFFKYKARYFGSESLARDITLGDLSEEEKELMLTGGFYHIQHGRDRNGRAIIYNFNHMLGRVRAQTLIRVAYYVYVNILLPIPEVQMKGVNVIYYDMANPTMDQFPSPSLNFCMAVMKFAASLPVRHSAMHMCLKNGMSGNLDLNDTIIGFTLKQFSQHDLVRTSLHFGSDIELQYQLRSRGIPLDDSFPVDTDGKLCREDVLNRWFYNHTGGGQDERMIVEPPVPAQSQQQVVLQAQEPANVQGGWGVQRFLGIGGAGQQQVMGEPARMAVEDNGHAWIQNLLLVQQHQQQQLNQPQLQPRDSDVLLGKGMRIQLHPGNVHFRVVLEGRAEEYDHTKRKEKPQFCTNMAMMFQSQGVRFLQQQSPGVWVETDLQEAAKKVGDL